MRVLERHARDVEAAGDGAHLLVGEFVDAADGLVDSSHDHVLQHIDILGIEGIGIDGEVDELHLAVNGHLDHTAAGRGVDGLLPGHADDSCRVLDLVWQTVGDVPISVMNQYTPNALMREQGGELARAVTREEYERVLDHADDLGFTTMFWQEGGAVDESFTPAFDTTGVLTSAK